VRNECPIRFSLSLSCRITQTPRNCSSGCPICFSLSVTFPTLNSTGATQHSIGHSLRLSMVAFFLCGECPEPHRQAEAYRTFVALIDSCLFLSFTWTTKKLDDNTYFGLVSSTLSPGCGKLPARASLTASIRIFAAFRTSSCRATSRSSAS